MASDLDIEKLESKKAELEADLSSGTIDPDEINEKAKSLNILLSELEKKSDRWLELSDLE